MFDLRHSTFVFTSFGVRRTRTKRQPFGEGALVERGVADFKLIVFVIEYATIGGVLQCEGRSFMLLMKLAPHPSNTLI